MRPFNVRRPDGERWHPRDEEVVSRMLRKEAQQELCERDAALGVPGSLRLSPNDRRCLLRHDGNDLQKLWEARREAFMAEPRDPKVELAKYGVEPSDGTVFPGINPALQSVVSKAVTEGLRPLVAAMQELMVAAKAGK